MSFEIRQLRYAVAAGDSGSFAKAAAKLRVKQSTLSRRILLLEQDVGLTIFERTTQGAVPTRDGAAFLAAARQIVDEAEGLRSNARAMGRGEAGRLVFGFSTSLSAGNLRAALSTFCRRYPEVELHGVEAGWDALMRGIAARTIDLAIIPGELPGEQLAKRHLWPERLMVALPEDHPAAKAETIFWTDLRDETFVLPRLDPGPDAADLVRARLRGSGVLPTIIMQDVSRENILSFLPIARYVTLVAETAAGAHHPGVVLREIHDLAGLAHVDFWAWWLPENENAALDGFLRLVGERYPAPAS
jgi:DNA-binding transcriptional LysR family regulator